MSSFNLRTIFNKLNAKYFRNLRAAVKQRYNEAVDYKEYEDRIRNMVDKHVGADEVKHTSTTAVTCGPASVQLGSASPSTTCTAVVTDSKATVVPTGSVAFSTIDPGSFSAPTCTLIPAAAAGTAGARAPSLPGT